MTVFKDWLPYRRGGGGETRGGSSPPFGTISILKGNLASRQVPFFRKIGATGQFLARGSPEWSPRSSALTIQTGVCSGNQCRVRLQLLAPISAPGGATL